MADAWQQRMVAGHRLQIRPLAARDAEPLMELHRRVFASAPTRHWFDWKYSAGGGSGMAAWSGGEMIAFCGGIPRNLARGAARSRGLQICDVMVRADWRGVLTRQGPFHHVCSSYYEQNLGEGRLADMGFGFPNHRHLTLAVKTGLSWDAGSIMEVRWTCDRSSPWERLKRPITFDLVDSMCAANVSGPWMRMHEDLVRRGFTAGIRDAAYLSWRYHDAQHQAYQFAVLTDRLRARPLGICVFRAVDPNDKDLFLLDWIGPLDGLDIAIRALRDFGAAKGIDTLRAWGSSTVWDSLRSAMPGQTDRVAGIGIPRASSIAPADLPRMRLWMMGGDTDFL